MARKKKESKLNMQESFLAHKYNISETTFLQIKSYIQYDENEKVEKWWSRVESNPYRLMSCEGFGFKRCDVIAQKVNFDMRSPVRINAYVSTAIENDAKGSSIVSFPKIIANIDKDLSINDIELVINSIKHSEDNDYVLLNGRYKLTEDKSTALYLTKKGWYYAEKFCFDWFKKLSKMNKPDVRGVRTFEKYPTLNVEQKYALEHFLDKNITLLIGGAGCLPHDTEVLTRDGWKAISECENEEIMVANPVDKEGIFGKFEKPIFRKYPVDQFYKITTGTNFDLTVSKEHKNLYITRKGAKYKDITTQELIDKMDLLDAHRKENEVKKSNLCVIPETFQWFGKGLDYSDDYIRLKVAVICDGYFAHNVKSNPYMCHVNLKKERKQQRLEYLLNKLNIKYTIQKSNEGYKNYYFCMDNDDKVFYKKWFFESNKHQREIIMEEILLWDGSTDKRDNSIGSFSTIIKETADTIQLIACSLGYRATMCKDPRKEKYSTGECYKITFSKNKLQGFHVMSSDTTKYEKVNQGEYMYCFTTSTGYFPIRQKNRCIFK